EGGQGGGRGQVKGVGRRMQPAANPDEDFAKTIVGSDQLRLDAEPPAQRERPRLFGQKRIGPGFNQKAVSALRRDRAAEEVTRLDDPDAEVDTALARELRRAAGCREAPPAAP